jgi:hypothetical protein
VGFAPCQSACRSDTGVTPRHECAKPLITKEKKGALLSATTIELIEKQEEKGIDRTLVFERESSVEKQSHFEQPLKSRLKRDSSITTCAKAILRAPSMTHRTPSMKMIEDFQKLEVQTDAADNKSSMFHRTPSTEIQDFQKLEVQGSQTLHPGFFNSRSSLFLFSDIETYD